MTTNQRLLVGAGIVLLLWVLFMGFVVYGGAWGTHTGS